jgi:hypothetical protein
MSDVSGVSVTSDAAVSPRRSFLGRLAGGSFALAASALFARPASAMSVAHVPIADDEPWLKPLAGKKHKQVFDAAYSNEGFPLIFASAYLGTMAAAYNLPPAAVGALVVCRHMGLCLALNDAVWAKYRLGAMFKVTDPATKAPAMRNIFYKARAGDMLNIDASMDKLQAQGAVIGACNVALTALSGMAAPTANVTPAVAYAEWKAGLHPGVFVLPSGVLGIGRSQESGCTYCFGGS